MMSENSSQAETKKVKVPDGMSQRALFARRKWVVVITAISCLLIYPVASVIAFISTINLNMFDTSVPMGVRLVNVFNTLISGNLVGFAAAVLLAVLTATQGFAYLFNRATVDFYESSPHTKKERFTAIYVNGLLIFYISITVSFILCFLSAGVMGAMNSAMIPQGIIQLLELMLLYSAVYSISTVASMLSGNLLVSMLLNGFLLLVEDVFYMAVDACGVTYYATWFNGNGEDRLHFFSPMACYITNHMPEFYSGTEPFGMTLVRSHIEKNLGFDIKLLLFFIIFTVVAFLLYKKRPMESAGRPFVYVRVGYAVKMIIAVFTALFTAIMMENVTGGDVPVVFAGVIISSALICVMMQALLIDGNAKKKLYHIAISSAVIIAVVIVCRFDLTGYENYIPSENSIESCGLMSYDNNCLPYYEKNDYGVYEEIYDGEKRLNLMMLKNISYVVELARTGQRLKSEYDRTYNGFARAYMLDLEEDEINGPNGWNYVVAYNLKNGKTVYRVIYIPVDTDTALLDRITTSPEYRSTVFQCEEDFVNVVASAGEHHKLSFYNGCRESKMIDGTYIRDFMEAYKKDIDEKYSYSVSRFHLSKGTVQFTGDDDYQDYISGDIFYLNYPVYDDYENTVAFLKQHGIYMDEQVPLDVIDSIRVTQTDEDGNSEVTEYESEEEIEKLMPKLYTDFGMWEWQEPNLVDYDRQAEIFTKKMVYEDEYFGSENYTLYFLNE